jgi:hypothetical protein
MLKFYPDRRWPAFRRLVQDALALLWTAFWAFAGWTVYQVVLGLQVIADGIRDTGRTFNDWLQSFKNAVPKGIPYLSDFLQNTATSLQRHTGDPLIQLSVTVRQDIATLAIALAIFIALPPILWVLLTYGPWRWREAREMGSALGFVKAAMIAGRVEQAKAVLAYRALATLSFTQLMKASRDPVGDLSNRDYDRLAAAMLDRAGLDPWRLAPPTNRKLLSPAPDLENQRRE